MTPEEYEYFLEIRSVETPCPKCKGTGVISYGSTSQWRGGIGGQAITPGPCDVCWGSGDKHRTWGNLRDIDIEVKEQKQEIKRLRSLLASQPRTKDGRIVVDGMGLYPDKDRRGFDDDIMQCHAVTQANWISDDGQTWTDDPSEFYSEPQQ